ncbi:MFS transporter [Arcanobacterium haemolyticum]|nr:MFS transporter [Arcanobacterium haemolyticum]
MSVFAGIFFGYAGFYLIRNNVSLVSAVLKEHDIMNTVGIGIVANAVLFAYGLSKFFMAMLSDRANARYFLPLGLALSAIVNLIIGMWPTITASVALFATVMFINGWFQGMGWPPSGRVLVQWFSTTERGWKTSIWNCAHNVGGAGAGAAAAFALNKWAADDADWTPAFWFPAIIALVVAVIVFFLIRDNPESMGLPPVEEWRDDPAKVTGSDEEAQGSWWNIVRRHVLTNPVILMLAITNVFVYTLRYGVLNWIPVYLTDEVGATNITGGIVGFGIYELAGIIGTILCGWVSDKVFKGWRSGAGILFLALVGVAIFAYWQLPAHAPVWMYYALIAVIGGLIYGPVMLIGLQAIDLSPKYVAGTAAGFTGLFGYLLGATLASSGVGYLIHRFGWSFTYMFLIVVVMLAVVLMVIVGRYERRLMNEREATKA